MLGASLLGGLLAFSSPSPGTAPDFTTPPELAEIWGGVEVTGTEYIETVHLRIGNAVCTGTFISPRIVLTAAHCIDETVEPQDICIMLGDTAVAYACWGSEGSLNATSYGMHPKFNDDGDNDYWDIGYVEAEGAVTGIDFPKIITDQDEYDALVGEEEPVILVGYGESENGEVDGKKRVVETRIERFIESAREFLAGGNGKDTCLGDSGGPAYARASDGSLRLIGVTSRGFPECGQGGLYTAPLPAMCWLEEASGADILPADCKDCECVDLTTAHGCGCQADKDPSSLALALFGLVFLKRRRRRTRP